MAGEPHGRAEAVPDRFLERLAVRDFAGMARLVAPDARARLLLPHGVEEHVGRAAIVDRIESWFGPATEFTLTASSSDRVGPRHRLSWRVTVVRDGENREDIEQVAFLDLAAGGIEWLDLLCSGFHKKANAAEDAAHFDAGAMGCADGLAQEFRRRLNQVAVGDSIRVVVRDPAAKEDLPALARLLGQSVTSTEAHADGRLEITVERKI